jgi:hypothetical protein
MSQYKEITWEDENLKCDEDLKVFKLRFKFSHSLQGLDLRRESEYIVDYFYNKLLYESVYNKHAIVSQNFLRRSVWNWVSYEDNIGKNMSQLTQIVRGPRTIWVSCSHFPVIFISHLNEFAIDLCGQFFNEIACLF